MNRTPDHTGSMTGHERDEQNTHKKVELK